MAAHVNSGTGYSQRAQAARDNLDKTLLAGWVCCVVPTRGVLKAQQRLGPGHFVANQLAMTTKAGSLP
jgi:hypothetical protein